MEETKFEGALVEHEGKLYREAKASTLSCDGCVFDTSKWSCDGPSCHANTIYVKVEENQDA